LVNKNPAIDPKNDIRAKVLTPPKVHRSFTISPPASLSKPIIDPKSKAIINLKNSDSSIKNYFNY